MITFKRLGLEERGAVLLVATGLLVIVAFLAGGASREHALRLAIVELAALPVLVLAAGRFIDAEVRAGHRFALTLLALAVALPLLQLIPLPPALWTALPGRGDLTLSLTLSDLPLPWLPITVTPDRTWRSFLALIPPSAMFLAVLSLPQTMQRRLIWLIIICTVASLILGIAQLTSRTQQWYPWTTTAAGNLVGCFANRNHMATLLLVGLPFSTILGATALRNPDARSRTIGLTACLFLVLAILALGAVRSRAGIILLAPCLSLSLLAGWMAGGRRRPSLSLLAYGGVCLLAVVLLATLGLGPVLERFDRNGVPEGRFENWPYVLRAASAYLPTGAGLGSFDTVFRSMEPLEKLNATFFNQAHNEYLETWLEAGWLGVGLILAFLGYWLKRSWQCWRETSSPSADLQRAASIAICVVLAHSAVDYPLRTELMAVVFAAFVAILEGANRSKISGPQLGG